MTKLTRCEQETTINYNLGEDKALIYTCSPHEIRRLKKLALEFEEFTITEEDKFSITVEVPKKLISIRKPRVLSDAQKSNLRKVHALNRERKQSENSK